MMITINAGAATLGTPMFGYIVDRTGSYRCRLASPGRRDRCRRVGDGNHCSTKPCAPASA